MQKPNIPYTIGTWVRAYTTSLRGPGESTIIGQICEYKMIKDDVRFEEAVHMAKVVNNSWGAFVPVWDIIGSIDIDALARECGVDRVADIIERPHDETEN